MTADTRTKDPLNTMLTSSTDHLVSEILRLLCETWSVDMTPGEVRTFASHRGFAGAIAEVTDNSEFLYPQERAAIEHAVPKRAWEYSTGRRAARHALLAIGMPAAAIVSEARRPRWPAGVAGSISHTSQVALAIVAVDGLCAGIGIDVEQERGLDTSLLKMVATGPEEAAIAHNDDPTLAATRLFSAKESIYKAANPITGLWLDFQDVELRFEHEIFLPDYVGDEPGNAIVASGRGAAINHAGHWVTTFAIPAGS